MSCIIQVFQAGSGDAIRIRFAIDANKFYNIFIDFGFANTYHKTLKNTIKNLLPDEKIDLLILTHLDADHINGALEFFRDKSIHKQGNIVDTVWFNYFGGINLPDHSNKVSFGAAIELRDILKNLNITLVDKVCDLMTPIEIYGAKITILSPDEQSLAQLESQWIKSEEKLKDKPLKEKVTSKLCADDRISINELSLRKDTKEDPKDIVNRSSIAFLFEHGEDKLLMLGDSHPSIVEKNIKNLLVNRSIDKLAVSYVKISHHGSVKNYSSELYDLIDSRRFIVSSNGTNRSCLPNKETLAKIIAKNYGKENISLYFNYSDVRLRKLFSVEDDIFNKYNFECVFPEPSLKFIALQ